MKQAFPRIMLAAPKSGSGKTVITCALLKALCNRGLSCLAFKCGPDYIDPMFHRYVLGIDGGNLDTYFLEPQQVCRQFTSMAAGTDISVLEGVMGYYDGVGGDSTRASSYEVAQATATPVILIIDGKGASLSIAAMAAGFVGYREDSKICGVILNRVSAVTAERLRSAIEELGLAYLGYVPECDNARLESRHLGLVTPDETERLQEKIGVMADQLEKTVDLEALLGLAFHAPKLETDDGKSPDRKKTDNQVRIGIAKDLAFGFYYQENLKLLEQMGARLIPFSPMADQALPEKLGGLLLGGGYPELYAQALSKNSAMRQEIKTAIAAGMPTVAECGGFLYLHEELEGADGFTYPMAGVIKGRAFQTSKLSRFGYISLESHQDTAFLKMGETVRGHEFHYWDSTDHGTDMTAAKPSGNRSWECMHSGGSLLAGFPHLYYPSNPAVAARFVGLCEVYKGYKGAERK